MPSLASAAAVVLAGGQGSRLGGVHKPGVLVGGRPIVERVLGAVEEAGLRAVVVGTPEGVPAGTPVVREDPPGGGPVAALAEGLRSLSGRLGLPAGEPAVVLVLAGDLPFLSGATLTRLRTALEADPGAALAVYLDAEGQPQWLCSAWRVAVLRARLGAEDAPRGVRGLATGLARTELADVDGAASADVDTPADLAAAAARVQSGHGPGPDAATL